ncbi:hypothetical protein HRR83_006108 [Exophiala dermatitidis]|uniref:Protein kinase domain-containing protein n=2 Tax=Exophiala dermatitidis TaxID=5970 RepID=H6BMM4_EXODN|nr:uncharacterized protein HMPREF1120_01252 [Exophiala dermatitidis NIH/UT8656]KAJ4515040.1 hypothetical protein HRR74_005505 [Exophiala dermatitidis]EHY53051.1 hypothetical protein HMPREF1120_01252 [Exophiala dermatitidis NIH/UT8656]KAJ4517531.1 hypothetical protein HRR73_004583 [Exophiala dermatitidis]KAJ4548712.1 hypothetical protein HRR76_001296 [Exophiala dermatitidis]KAJ4552570.1 hypothetical protein HRR77_002574 [Exophiala dermatitidis]
MDPGTVLAIASLSFQVFGGCVKGFVLLSRAHNLGKDASLLQTMLNLEEYRFIQWARAVGLISDEEEEQEQEQTTSAEDTGTGTQSTTDTATSSTANKAKDGSGTTTIVRVSQKSPRKTNTTTLDPRLNYALAAELMGQLERLLSTDQLRKRYKLDLSEQPQQPTGKQVDDDNPLSPVYSPITTTTTATTTSATGAPTATATSTTNNPTPLQRLVSDKLRKRILARAKLIQDDNHLPKRLWWAAVDKKKFEDMVKDVRVLVDGLWALLDPIQRRDSSWLLNEVLARMVQLSKDVGELRALQGSTGVSGDVAAAVDLKMARIEINDPDPETDRISGISGISLLSQTQTQTQTQTNPYRPTYQGQQQQYQYPPPPRYLSGNTMTATNSPKAVVESQLPPINKSLLENVVPSTANSNVATGIYDKNPVWLEYKQVPQRMKGKLLSRVKGLAFLLSRVKHPSFHTLRCLGFFEDGDRFVFVYSYPQTSIGDSSDAAQVKTRSPPKSLNELIRENKTLKSPSVTTRLDIASKLANTLLILHTAGWLHKDLRSENVVFFDNDWSVPYVTGFSFSRQDSPAEISEQPSSEPQADIYRHPHALGEPSTSFQKHMDLYSLGLVLVELAEWKALKYIVKDCVDVRKQPTATYSVSLNDIAQVPKHLIDHEVKNGQVHYRMGDTYARQVGVCLNHGLSPLDAAPDTLQDLLDMVRSLENCRT